MKVKGRLVIDFELTPQGRKVNVTGVMQMPNGQAIDLTADLPMCLGLLEYAKGPLWEKEAARMEATGTGAIEIPVGVDGEALRVKG